MTDAHLSSDQAGQSKRLGLKIDRVWLWKDQFHFTQVSTTKPDPKEHPEAIEYMRVLSRQEVEKLASDGVDTQQYLNSLIRTIEGQRKEINRLKEELADATRERQGDECASY